MKETNVADLQQDLIGRAVVDADTASKLGCITDFVIDPANGTVTALLFQSPNGRESALISEDVLIHQEGEAIIAFGDPIIDQSSLGVLLKEGVSAKSELLNSTVITDEGGSLGRISKIFIQTEPMQAIYFVTKSAWQRLIGGGFFLNGNAVRAHSRLGARLIVPHNARRRYAHSSLSDSIRALKRNPTSAQ